MGAFNKWYTGTNPQTQVIGQQLQPDTGYSLQGGMDWIGKNSDALNTGMGLAGMGLNAYSTLFGQGKNAYNKNMTLLDQQIAGNKEKLGRRDALNTAWANTEKVQPKPQGLASSGQGYL